MSVQITILGLGQIGSSIGLALAKQEDQIHRVGHDKDREAVSYAKKHSVVDRVAITLSGAVKDADIVILALPLQEIYPVLEHISQDLQEGCLVIDTGPLKEPVIQWASDLLPEGCDYVGLTPVISSDFLDVSVYGPETAQADLFKGTLMGIVGGKNATEGSINSAVNLVHLLEASPYFSDPVELDGLMTLTYILPALLSALLLKTSQDGPGWREARKVAGKAYNQVSKPFAQDEIAGALAAQLTNNKVNSSRVINDLVRELIEIRDLGEGGDQKALENYFTTLQQGRDLWLKDRRANIWVDTPRQEIRKGGVLAGLLGFRQPRKPNERS